MNCPNCELFTEHTSYCLAEQRGAAAERAAVVKYLRALAVDEDLYLSATSAGLAKQWADAIERGEHVP